MTDANIRTSFDLARRLRARALGALSGWCVVALVAAGIALTATDPCRAAEPAPQATHGTGTAVPRLPVIDAQGPTTHIEGKIVRTSRGRKGPVRLLVERKSGGDQVTILVAPDEVCDRLGLSLQSGEAVDVEGALVKGDRPILIASAFKMPDGKVIRVRDASGNLIDGGTSGAAAGGSAAHRATMSGAPPAPSVAPAK